MRLGHARGLACAKTKKFPCIFLASPPPTPPPRSGKEMERKFLVLLRRFSLRKEQSYFNIFVCSFLRPHGDRGALLSAFGGNSKLCASDNGSINSSKWSLAIQNSLRNGEAQILYVFAPPSRVSILPSSHLFSKSLTFRTRGARSGSDQNRTLGESPTHWRVRQQPRKKKHSLHF